MVTGWAIADFSGVRRSWRSRVATQRRPENIQGMAIAPA